MPNTHKGSTVTVVRPAAAGDPGLDPSATVANMKLVQKPPPPPIISSSLLNGYIMPVPTQGICYCAPTAEIL
jgi:hypothetical protein